MRCLVHLSVLLVLVTGCAETSDRPARRGPALSASSAAAPLASPTSPSPLRLSRADLEASIPTAADLFPWRVRSRCSAKAVCAEIDQGRDHGRGALVLAEGTESRQVHEHLLVGTFRWPTRQAASAAVSRLRSRAASEYGDRIRTPPTRITETRYRLGMRGTGRVMGYTARVAWTGFIRSAEFSYVHLDGRRTAKSQSVDIVLARDRYTVHVRVDLWIARRGEGAAARLAAIYLDDLLRQLERRSR